MYWMKKRHDRVNVIRLGLAIPGANSENAQVMMFPAPSSLAVFLRACHPQAPTKLATPGIEGARLSAKITKTNC